jgi:hypothetical protein
MHNTLHTSGRLLDTQRKQKKQKNKKKHFRHRNIERPALKTPSIHFVFLVFFFLEPHHLIMQTVTQTPLRCVSLSQTIPSCAIVILIKERIFFFRFCDNRYLVTHYYSLKKCWNALLPYPPLVLKKCSKKKF